MERNRLGREVYCKRALQSELRSSGQREDTRSMKNRSAFSFAVALTALVVTGCSTIMTKRGSSFRTLTINAKSNIFRAGTGDLDETGGGEAPASVSFEQRSGWVLTFEKVSGRVSCCSGGEEFNDADGGTFAGGVTDVESAGGISGITHPDKTMFLVGVFTDDSAAKPPGPPRLGANDPKNLTPELFQSFFIGTGKGKQIQVPPTATRLVLGFADASNFNGRPGAYDDNVGELIADFSFKQK
jgi:hypothetical protein